MNHQGISAFTDNQPYRTRRFPTPFGDIEVTINDQCIVASHYTLNSGSVMGDSADGRSEPTISSPIAAQRKNLFSTAGASKAQRHLFQQIGEQLDEYFSGTNLVFTLPLCAEDEPSEFTKVVREEMTHIPPGDVLTYGELAEAVGRPRAARAVGTVCRTNPIQLFIPCHRVIAAGGSLGGYMGGSRGLVLKQQLLEKEGVPFTAEGKVDFNELARRQ
ncbi:MULTISPECIES: methylated-DNA--[protein]-cysteine S-methyltransferase [Corynebacterium]|uniref:methylated-DNA--[protein]-cysteine S-methyltransferase n=1 Tax=Corynebacterium TaxID=1716 RepID=UPI001EF4FEAD|nr:MULTISPECIES: MGMT family protein [Corynebacterium]MDN8624929.1 MGMT family protein [Corynebacterium kroppenstedtii]